MSNINPEQCDPALLEALIRKKRTWLYPWTGILVGIAVGVFIGHPLSMLAHEFYNSLESGAPMDIKGAILHSFHWHMLPMTLIFAGFGGITWGFIGFILQHLKESRLRLDAAHRELLRQARYLNTYLTVSSMVAQCLDPHELLEAVLNIIMETVSAEGASVLFLEENQANFRFYGLEGPAKQCLMAMTFPADKGIAGSILQTQRSEVINDVQRDPRFFRRFDSESGLVTQNLIAIPLTAGEEKIGVMEVLNKSGGEPFTDEERLLLDSIAEEIAFAFAMPEFSNTSSIATASSARDKSRARAARGHCGHGRPALNISKKVFRTKDLLLIRIRHRPGADDRLAARTEVSSGCPRYFRAPP